MDVKGANALSKRLAEAARNVDLPLSKAVDSVDTSDASEVADTTAQGQRETASSRDLRSLIPGGHKFRGLRASI
jgi:hypothetical protein